jgi:hypothetical protein
MRSRSDCTPYPFSVFSPAFLQYLEEQDEPITAAEAESAGVWGIERLPEGTWGVVRPGDSVARGDEPEGVFHRLEHAVEAAVVFPTLGRDNLFTLQPDKTPRGFAIEMPGELVGHLRHFDTTLTDRMHLADCLLRTPDSLGRLLRAAGGAALIRADKLLLHRLFVQEVP